MIHVDRFVTAVGLAPSISAARRLREAGAVSFGVEGEGMEVVRELYVKVTFA